ncbi:P-loop NTPase [uncultured Thiodictyon sp.]|uniref:P-loop NTPase n=1 Tax=uncultured Thiodictyon sp. TaxID=1846217 RepID=UPI0025F97337|nr:P-loop NTPase [uncultured Thiodictyon sp.]
MIVTFYSYKGGVGRSMALANVAEWFRRQGLKVVMVDWDLEAPGLESFFSTDAAERESLGGKPGLIDIIVAYRDMFSGLAGPNALGPLPGDGAPAGKYDFIKFLEETLALWDLSRSHSFSKTAG